MNRGLVFVAIACCCTGIGETGVAQSGPTSSPQFTEQFEAGKRALEGGHYRDAVGYFKKANKLEGNSCYPCLLGMAHADLKLEDYENAVESSVKAIGAAKDDHERAAAHNLKGNILIATAQSPKDLANAEDEYKAATELDKSVPVYHLNCATAMIRQSKDEAAKAELQICLDAHPGPDLGRQAQALLADPRRGRETFAPDFNVKVISGEAISLQKFAGKVLVMDFWATWCPPCRASVSELKDLTRKYPAEQLVLISVSADDNEDEWREFVGKKHMDWLQYRDSNHQLLEAFGVHSFPTYLVIDGDGIIRQRLTGLNPQETVVHRLRATLETMPQLRK